MNTPSAIPLGKRIFLSFVISWLAALSLGIVYGARVIGTVDLAKLWVMTVIQVAAIISSVIAVFLTPLIVWGLRSYGVIKWILLLWLLMIAWVLMIFALTHSGGLVLIGGLLLSVGGLVSIRFIGNR